MFTHTCGCQNHPIVRSVSNALVVAKLAVILTTRELYAQALIDFWYIHKAIEVALEEQQDRSAGMTCC